MIFEGKKAIVTGGSRGIGKAVALDLARQGADVAVMAQNIQLIEEVAGEIEAMGRKAMAVPVDVSDFDSASSAMQQVFDAWKNVDFLVNNAGIVRDALILRLTPEDWGKVISVNLNGVYNCTKAVLKEMVSVRMGRIVNITSVIGAMGAAGQSNYAASKAGIIGFTKSCAREVASRKITVNAVAPGFIETDMTDALDDKIKQGIKKSIPMKHFGCVGDVAGSVRFLFSPQAAYVTGQVLHVNGGLYM